MAKYVKVKRYSDDKQYVGVCSALVGGQRTLLSVYERVTSHTSHSCVTFFDSDLYGKVNSRRPESLPEDYEKRKKFLDEYRDGLRKKQLELLHLLFPELANAPTQTGIIEVLGDLEVHYELIP